MRHRDAAAAIDATQFRAQNQTDPGACDVRQQRLLAVNGILQQAHVANFQAAVHDGILLGRERGAVGEQSLDHIDASNSQPQAAEDRTVDV